MFIISYDTLQHNRSEMTQIRYLTLLSFIVLDDVASPLTSVVEADHLVYLLRLSRLLSRTNLCIR
jgi:hypothetical protein